ncbi:MAG: 3-isopropylmalate dehydratase [Deltaproteobacteria bacterium]|nr:3-isopropylmalate dehydratase [Deltaproteobacteria bacterium]
MTFIKGRVWKFGDNVNTDVMAPGFAFNAPWEELKRVILHIHPKFTQEAKPGDVIVAGKNWGCGSSREQAPANLKRLGIGCVVAESFGRIYFRNSVALAFPSIVCLGISEAFDEGDELELELESARVRNITKGDELKGEALSKDMLAIIAKGGIIPALRERLKIKK